VIHFTNLLLLARVGDEVGRVDRVSVHTKIKFLDITINDIIPFCSLLPVGEAIYEFDPFLEPAVACASRR